MSTYYNTSSSLSNDNVYRNYVRISKPRYCSRYDFRNNVAIGVVNKYVGSSGDTMKTETNDINQNTNISLIDVDRNGRSFGLKECSVVIDRCKLSSPEPDSPY